MRQTYTIVGTRLNESITVTCDTKKEARRRKARLAKEYPDMKWIIKPGRVPIGDDVFMIDELSDIDPLIFYKREQRR